jgi:SAM-dependent methyltransferase
MCAKSANWTYPALTEQEGTDPATRAYLQSPRIAVQYDQYFHGSPLFAFDTQVLTHWLPRPGRLIDLGCGTGRHLLHFARRGFQATGVDLSEHMLSAAASKLAACPGRWRLVRANLCQLPDELLTGDFDAAVCMFSTLGMIRGRRRRAAFCRDVLRCLRPGGLLALHAHNRTHNWLTAEGIAAMTANLLACLLRRREWGDKKLDSYRGIRDMVVHVFTRRELVDLLTGAGFRVAQVLALNETRNAVLQGRLFRGLRANGYLVLARKPAQSFREVLSQHQQRRPSAQRKPTR